MTAPDDSISSDAGGSREAAAPEPAAPEPASPEPGASEHESAPEAPRGQRRRFPWKTLAAAVVILLLALPVYSTLQPRYYERYPALRPRVTAWSESTHARISCAQCHLSPGPIGFVTFAAKSIPAFYSQLIVGPNSTNLLQVPSRQACQKCHVGYRTVSPAGDLLIPHQAHVEILKVNCPTCHKNLVHSKNTLGYNKPEMQTCLNLCHNGTKATSQCEKCHTRKQVPEGHKNKNWLTVHPTMVNSINCGQCHAWSPNYCKECHSHRPPSHVGNWKQLHQFRVKQRGDKGCLFCHGETFCKQCH